MLDDRHKEPSLLAGLCPTLLLDNYCFDFKTPSLTLIIINWENQKPVPMVSNSLSCFLPTLLFLSLFLWSLLGVFFLFVFFPSVQLISSDLMDEDGRSPADYQSRQMKAETGRQLSDAFYRTHLRWIPTAPVCCPVRLNLSPLAGNWSCLLLYPDRILLTN